MCSSLAGAEAGDGEDHRHRTPGHFFAPPLDALVEEFVQPKHPPQPPGQPDVAKVAWPFQTHAAELHQERLVFLGRIATRRIEERTLQASRRGTAAEMGAELGPAVLFLGGQLAQIGDDALPRSFSRAIGLDQRPIRVRLAVLSPLVASQEHERSVTPRDSSPISIAQLPQKSKWKVFTTTPLAASRPITKGLTHDQRPKIFDFGAKVSNLG